MTDCTCAGARCGAAFAAAAVRAALMHDGLHEQKTAAEPLTGIQGEGGEALGDGKTVAEIAQRHDVHPNQVTEWRPQLMERAANVFGAAVEPGAPPVDLKALQARIGQLTLENDFLESALGKAGLLSAKR